ncbi:MAG: hypothetical protein M1837_004834 [Sclerophora amabilis]|nr:MAG: hypothetical protein M1837_004834 [Sclerophora amabilis]
MSSTAPQDLFRCTFEACPAVFQSQALLRSHKINSEDHIYCKTCNEDFEDDKALFVHKIQSKRHIVCPVCEVDFKSQGGLKLHVNQMHRAKQDLHCAGCGEVFPRAGSLMAHIEQNACAKIKPIEFQARRARREILNRFLADPEAFRLNAASEASTDSVGEGGVHLTEPSLIDSDDSLVLKEEPLQPEKPKEPIAAPGSVASRNGFGSKGVLTDLPNGTTDEDRQLRGMASSTSLFPNAIKKFGISTKPETADEIQNENGIFDETYNEAWDPKSKSFRPSSFFQRLTGKYHCPHPQCRASFTKAEGFRMHLDSVSHLTEKVKYGRSFDLKPGSGALLMNATPSCPTCLRLFKTTTALVQHCESPSTRCKIRDSDSYNKALDTFTGGILETNGHHEDGTVRYEAVAPDW